jgi:RNA polymerase sigma factor (sigma-70 family)
MPRLALPPTATQLRRLATPQEAEPLSDAELLQHFALRRDEIAFEALVARHGPMVLGVAQAVLRHTQDAEDVFQAVYLLLARQASAIRQGGAVGGWLHRVAFRLALRRRQTRERQKRLEESAPPAAPVPPAEDLTWAELRQILHEELQRMPDKLRAALVLCYLEGRTQDEATVALGWPRGTLKGRLERGRKLLRGRLVRRGLGASAVLLASVVQATAAVPATLACSTTGLAVSQGAAGVGASAQVTALVEAGTRLLLWAKLKTLALGAVVFLGLFAVGLVSWYGAATGDSPVAAAPVEVRVPGTTPPAARKRLPEVPCCNVLSPDGKMLATSGREGVVRVWNPESGSELFRLNNHIGYAYCVAFSPDCRSLATGDMKNVYVWDANSGKLVKTFAGFDGGAELEKDHTVTPGIRCVAFSPDGRLLAAGEGDRRIRLWDVRQGKDLGSLEQRGQPIRHLSFLKDGNTLVCCAGESDIQLWDVTATRAKVNPKEGMCRIAVADHPQPG